MFKASNMGLCWNRLSKSSDEDLPSLTMECPICYEEISDDTAYWLPCSHVYHRKCITEWFGYVSKRSQPFCPICSTSLVQCNENDGNVIG